MHGDECIYTAVVLVIAGTSIRVPNLVRKYGRRAPRRYSLVCVVVWLVGFSFVYLRTWMGKLVGWVLSS
jgi:hypothetical protein